MNSRMERYKDYDSLENTITRSERNRELYENVNSNELSRVKTNNNIKVIENGSKDIDIEKIKRYITSMNGNKKEVKRENIFQSQSGREKMKIKEEETKDYDINSVLEKARKGREVDYEKERYKKLHNTEYDILSKLKVYEEEMNKKDEEDITEEFNTNEKTLIDLINTVTIHKDDMGLLDELTGGHENTEIIKPMKTEPLREEIKEEIMKELEEEQKKKDLEKTQELVKVKNNEPNNIDKSFYTNSMTFSKEDFEGFEELEKSVKKNNILFIAGVVFLIIAIIVTLIIIANYVFDLGLF